MQTFLDQLSTFFASHFVAAMSAVGALVGAALLRYFREQVRAFADWVLAPLNRLLPWDRKVVEESNSAYQPDLVADFSLVEVFVEDVSGKLGSYRKLSSYRAIKDLSSYREGVCADGLATHFLTMRGTIVQTSSEHGFFVSQIELGAVVHRGAHITNLYEAKLLDCFTADEECWTQEVAFPTMLLTMQIHFPVARPPKMVKCFAVEGTADREIAAGASITELFGKKAIVWQMNNPSFRSIYKISWRW
jgi:hypothetical protein